MASNPIQRRARQSFLVGFLLALIIMAVVVVILFMRINNLTTENSQLSAEKKSKTKTIYVLSQDVKSGETITQDMLSSSSKVADIDISNYLTPSSFQDEEGNEIELVAKTDLTSGSPVLTNTVRESTDVLTSDERIMEFNMISLPSQLQNGDYVDIRFSLPNGNTYIVLSKKHVEQTTATGIWMKLTEEEILMMNSAIVESYQVTGSNLTAVQYTEPGLQDAAIQTYSPSESVITLIYNDQNIVDTARNALTSKLAGNYSEGRSLINTYKDTDTDSQASSVASGNATENEAISSAREEYVSSLEGTGLVGKTE